MKIRKDFVTNSSSTSYIVAFKDMPSIDEEAMKKYPFLESYQKIIKEAIFDNSGSYETSTALVFENLKDFEEYLLNVYGCGYKTIESLCKEDEYVEDIYNQCVRKLGDGYKILTKNIGYGDYREELFSKLESDDFIIITGDEK